MVSQSGATLIGFMAILMWSLLALLTAGSGVIPPFQLSGMAFLLGGLVGFVALIIRRKPLSTMLAAPQAMAIGIAGLFGYHFLYFTALRNAPEIEAGLIAYLWPLMIVLGSALMPGERLRWHHCVGAVAGAVGAALIVTKGISFSFDPAYGFGYGIALLCAFTWAGYSLASRRFAEVPSDAVTLFCFVTSLLSWFCHWVWESTVWPATMGQWLSVVGLGLLPVGLAFYAWDYGVKHGDIQVLGALSYAAPLLSTLILMAAGMASFSWVIALACVLISVGGLVAAKDLLRSKR